MSSVKLYRLDCRPVSIFSLCGHLPKIIKGNCLRAISLPAKLPYGMMCACVKSSKRRSSHLVSYTVPCGSCKR